MRGADIVVEASRLEQPEPLLRTAWIEPGALVVPYGTMSAVELSLTEIMDKVVVDDWGQCATGRLGALRAHVDAGLLDARDAARRARRDRRGHAPGRESDRRDDRLLASRAVASPTSRSATRCSRRRARLGVGQTPALPLSGDVASLLDFRV